MSISVIENKTKLLLNTGASWKLRGHELERHAVQARVRVGGKGYWDGILGMGRYVGRHTMEAVQIAGIVEIKSHDDSRRKLQELETHSRRTVMND